jgi:hypothetical protein
MYMPKSHVFKTKLVLFSVQIFQNLHFTYLEIFCGYAQIELYLNYNLWCNVIFFVMFIREVPRMGFF